MYWLSHTRLNDKNTIEYEYSYFDIYNSGGLVKDIRTLTKMVESKEEFLKFYEENKCL